MSHLQLATVKGTVRRAPSILTPVPQILDRVVDPIHNNEPKATIHSAHDGDLHHV